MNFQENHFSKKKFKEIWFSYHILRCLVEDKLFFIQKRKKNLYWIILESKNVDQMIVAGIDIDQMREPWV